MNTGDGYFTLNEGDITVNFSSVATDLNTGDKTAALTYTDNDNGSGFGANYDGWNFISNPFPSAIDWSALSKSTNTDATVYIWNGTTANYVYFGGAPQWQTGQTNNGAVSQYIPAMQGFWVHLTNASLPGNLSENFTFNNTARIHNAQAMHKNTEKIDYQFIRLEVMQNNLTDETLIGYFDDAETGFDTDYDAYKRLSGNDIPMLYSLTEEPAFPLAMNALPADSLGKEVPLGLYTSHSETCTISLKEDNLEGRAIFLKDFEENTVTNLSENDYLFEVNSGDSRERFVLFVDAETNDVDNNISKSNIKIFPNPTNGLLIIQNLNKDETNTITVKDVLGKTILQTQTDKTQTELDLTNNFAGIYFIEVSNNSGTVIIKLIKN